MEVSAQTSVSCPNCSFSASSFSHLLPPFGSFRPPLLCSHPLVLHCFAPSVPPPSPSTSLPIPHILKPPRVVQPSDILLQVEVWPPAAPRFVSAPSNPPSAPAPADHQADATARPSNIIYEDGSALNHRSPSRPGAPAADAAGMPLSAQPASVTIGSGAAARFNHTHGLAAADRPQSTDRNNEGCLLSSQQHGSRAVLGSALPASPSATWKEEAASRQVQSTTRQYQ